MMQISGLLARHALYRPNQLAVVFEDQRLTWLQYNSRVNRLANALLAQGVQKGDRVTTVLPNCLELLDIYWACAKIGAVMVPLSPLLMAGGLKSLLYDAAPKVVFTNFALAGIVAQVRGDVPSIKACVSVDGQASGFIAHAELVAGQSDRLADQHIAPDDLYNIMYTSGTTGMPKGIMHTQRIRAHYGTLFANGFRIKPESVVLHTGAIVFNGAMVTLFPCFTQGATYILHRQFDAQEMINTIERDKVTHIMLVPSQIIAMLNAPNFAPEKLASLEMILSLGAPLHVEHKNILEAAVPNVFYELYGLTEGFITILDRDDAVRKRGSVGVPPPFYEMRIVREDGITDAAVNEVGEIVGKSPLLMPGYYNRPDLTATAIKDDWLFTGDLGYVDEDGFLFLVDRKKDMIDTGGVKVYPRDVEEVVVQHPAVLECSVFGVPDEKWGETPVAAVVLREGSKVSDEELKAWINERVGARYQRVSRVIVYLEFPRNAAGKILKREMREPFWAGKANKI